MMKLKRIVPAVLIVAILVCGLAAFTYNNAKDANATASTSGSVRNIATDYELDTKKSLAIAVVKEKSEGPFRRGYVTLAEQGVSCQELKSDVLYFYDEARLKALCKADDADCRYNNYTFFESRGYYVMDEEFYKKAKETNHPITYDFYLDWNYKDTVEVGDVILIDVGTLLNKNPNNDSEETPQHHLIIQPFGTNSKSPILAKFVNGKLQLPEELKDSLNLRRLYDDTEPERIAIKDGDSVDDVIAFIKCVEQDVARFQNEAR